jgi:uncharacterized protein YcbK (DUF882 family)
MKLSTNFSLHEFACPCGCGREKLPRVVAALKRLCERRLEPVRAACGDHRMTIHSGVRCALYNAKCGGAKASKHMVLGKVAAADVFVEGVPTLEVWDAAWSIARNLGSGGVKAYVNRAKGRTEFVHMDDRASAWLPKP